MTQQNMTTENVQATSLAIIESHYGKSSEGFYNLPAAVAKDVTKLIVNAEQDDPRLFQKVQNAIWNVYAGGDNADTVAVKIFAELGLAQP